MYYGVYKAIDTLPVPGCTSGLEKLHFLMESLYPEILKFARDFKLPIIDLPRTFDATDGDLYKCQIEPSAKGGALIADLIAHVVKNHDFDGPSAFYFKRSTSPGPVVVEANDGSAPWKIAPAWS